MMKIINKSKVVISLLLGVAIISPAYAQAYLPSKGSQVLERLPSRNDPIQKELNQLRTQLNATPNDLKLATSLAQRYINLGRLNADPRYLGYAQAALSPWWSMEQPPSEVLVLRATLMQSTHQFQKALSDLSLVLKTDRNNAQAWLTSATVLQVIGDYDKAKKSCEKLYSLAPELIVQTCFNNVANLNGDAQKSYDLMVTALNNNPNEESGIQIWVLTLLAEMAQRLGNFPAAEQYFKKALSTDVPDSYLIGAYADFLLDRGRNQEVITLLKDRTRADGLLLRYAIALKASQSNLAAAQVDILNARFDAAMLRGDTVHQREQARFELQLKNNPQRSLAIAQSNWAIQKEPTDTRILLEAALAAKDKAAAKPILVWLKKVALQDSAITRLTTALETL